MNMVLKKQCGLVGFSDNANLYLGYLIFSDSLILCRIL